MKKSLNLCMPLFAFFVFLSICLYSGITLIQWNESQCYIKDIFKSTESYELYDRVKKCQYELFVSTDTCEGITDFSAIISHNQISCNDYFSTELYHKNIQCYYNSDCDITIQSMNYTLYTILLLLSFAALCYTLTYIHYICKYRPSDDIIPMEIV